MANARGTLSIERGNKTLKNTQLYSSIKIIIMTNIVEVESKIITLRDQQVILDSDVAELYGVETKRINEAVSNNPEKFPEGYVLMLTNEEKTEVVEIFDHLSKLRFSPQLPKAFTEKGLYMLVTILKSHTKK